MKSRVEMMGRLAVAVAAAVVVGESMAATRRVVSREQDRTGDWASASLDLVATVASARPGDEIIVGEGTYAFSSAVAVKAANLTIRSSRLDADEPAPETTVLDAGGACRFFTCATAGTAPSFEGFTFRNGNAGSQNGGALLFDSVDAWKVSGCVFENNAATGSGRLGGAIVSAGCVGGLVTNCVFRGNVASYGAAVGLYQVTDAATDKCTLADCLFTNNVLRAVDRNSGGAAIWAAQGARLIGCRIVENAVEYVSEVPITGGIVKLGNNSTVVGTTFRQTDYIAKYSVTDSTAASFGDGLVMSDSTVELPDLSDGGVSVLFAGANSQFDACRFVVEKRGPSKFPFGFAGANPVFRNCLFVNRSRDYDAVSCWGEGIVSCENCTFYNENPGRMVILGVVNGSRIVNCAVVGAIAASAGNVISNSCVLAAATPGSDCAVFENNLVGADPRFADAAAGDFQLRKSSALRDRGVLLDWMTASSKDLAGGCRVMGRGGVTLADDPSVLPDMGCCELQTVEGRGLHLLFR